MGVVSGFYVPYHDGLWLIEGPEDWRDIGQFQTSALSRSMDKEVYSRELSNGLHISGLQIGIFKFDFSNLPAALLKSEITHASHFPLLLHATAARLKIMNAFALCLHSAYIQVGKMEVDSFWLTHDDLLHYDANGVSGFGMRNLPAAPLGQMPRRVVSRDVVDAAVDLLDVVLGHDYENAASLFALLNHALASHKRHNFELAVVSSWTVCEALLNELWKMYYTGESAGAVRSGLTKSRIDKLEGRDFTASVVSEILNLAGLIDSEMLRALDYSRSRRNKWLHGGKSPEFNDSGRSLDAARGMMRAVLGIDVNVGTGIGASGL